MFVVLFFIFQESWAFAYGGTGDDMLNFVQQTSDSTYIVAGQTNSFGVGDWDCIFARIRPVGNIDWVKTRGSSVDDRSFCVRQTADSGFIISGWTWECTDDFYDFLIVKTDANGVAQWIKNYDAQDASHGESAGAHILQTSDGGYMVFAHTYWDDTRHWEITNFKIDENGNVQWSSLINDGAPRLLTRPGQQTSDGGYIACGREEETFNGPRDIIVYKYNPIGGLEWIKKYGEAGTQDVVGFIEQTSDGGYILGGSTRSYGAGGYDCLALKLDSTGVLEWAKTYGGTADDRINCIQEISGGGYIVVGSTASFGGGGSDALIIKLNSTGDIDTASTLGSAGDEGLSCVEQTQDGGYIACGNTSSWGAGGKDFLLMKLESDATIPNCTGGCMPTVTPPSVTVSIPSLSGVSFNVLTGSCALSETSLNPSVVKLCPLLGVSEIPTLKGYATLTVVPTLSRGEFTMYYFLPYETDCLIKIYDLNGEIVKILVDSRVTGGSYRIEWDGRDNGGNEVRSSMYYCVLKAKTEKMSKMIIIR